MKYIILGLFLSASTSIFAQNQLTWQTLRDVQYEEKYVEEVESEVLFPKFGGRVKSYEGMEVYISGYMIVLDAKTGIYVLSANTFASCFFCGQAGPESIVELKLKPGYRKFKTDERVTVKGTLRLNDKDIYQLNYILEEAEEYKITNN
jgi:hypothetical protein